MPSHKNVLIVTYYWPPAGGPGVQRWLKFVKYLPQFAINPIVYTPENPEYAIIDNSLMTDVAPNLTVIKQPIKEPYKLVKVIAKKKSTTLQKGIITTTKQSIIEKIMLFIRGNFFIPDARVAWVKPSVVFLSKYIKKNNIDTVITTGPPHSMHLIGLALQKKNKIQWIADFRDPWTTISYHKKLRLTKAAKAKHKTLERKVLTTANKIIVTSWSTKEEFKKITKQPIQVITNGYDVETNSKVALDKKFSITHIGSLLSERNPEVLWNVLEDISKENSEFSSDFVLRFVGEVSKEVLDQLKKHNLSNYLDLVSYVTHNESIKFQKKSQVLLVIEIDSEETKAIIPGKVFEYMASNRPILAIGPKLSDVEKIITTSNTGTYFSYDQYNQLKAQILAYYKAYKQQNLNVHAVGIQQYSRKALTQKLAAYLKDTPNNKAI